ncbi:organic solute transporter subunit beta [Prionailurus iriomotensis]
MDHNDGVIQAPAGTVVPQELLEEMLWFFRVEDASPWNYSIFALVGVVIVISIVLLRKSIQANSGEPVAIIVELMVAMRIWGDDAPQNQKILRKNKPETTTLEVQDLAEAGAREDNNLNMLRETLLSEKQNLAQVETELKGRKVSLVLLPDPQESES